ncbi:hypothetical protein GOODEAATRI_025607 [Goodea atripinnis]|uniref:Transducer of regulated CREB activity N-terminal domain-containing protein n=1 Tax=Goodea atripinnis TaxID=208336 RepID=A0ABV0P7S6_9TELE
MSATGLGGPGPGPGPATGSGSGASNPRKFSEKIALHTQRQAEETAAFQEVMMDITSTRVSVRRRQEEGSSPEEERPVRGCERLPDNLGLLVRVGKTLRVSRGAQAAGQQVQKAAALYQQIQPAEANSMKVQ